MQRHELSVFSLLAGVVFAAIATLFVVTDGRLFAYNVHWGSVAIAGAGLLGVALVTAATRRIAHERRLEAASGFAVDE